MELNHLHLNSADVEQTAAFYARWFGFRRHKLVDDGALLFMRNERDFDLALSNEGEERALPKWFHFGFRLDSAERVRSLRGEGEKDIDRADIGGSDRWLCAFSAGSASRKSASMRLLPVGFGEWKPAVDCEQDRRIDESAYNRNVVRITSGMV